MIAYVWSMFKPIVTLDHIAEVGGTICWAAKWLGNDKVTFRSVYHHGHEKMVQDCYDMLNTADTVVTYNGDRFDLPTLRKEFLLQELPPEFPYKSVDLYKVVRKEFRFDSNKLDHVCQQLGIGAKVQHKGMELWKGCMDNDRGSWAEMKAYNIQDAELLEPLYKRLIPRIKKGNNLSMLYPHEDVVRCCRCGGEMKEDDRLYETQVNQYQAYICTVCKSRARGRKALVDQHKENVVVPI
jgi:DNA polymerase elongation subunit (family B)